MKLFLTLMFLSCPLVKCTPQFTNCPTSPLCVNESVSYQCRVDTSGSADALQWRVFNATGSLIGVVSYGLGLSVGSMGSIGTQFTTNLTSTGDGSIVSNITFTATMDINNYTVQCRAIDTVTPAIVGTDTCSVILIESELDQPTVAPNISAINPNNYAISWPPSTNRCIISYTVFINSPAGNSSFEDVPVDTGLVVNTPQFNDTVYTISVAAVDTVGREYKDPDNEVMLIIDVPESVTNLMLNQTGLSIDVSWSEPPDSFRPELLSYIISVTDNVTDFDTSTMILAPTATDNIPGITMGSVYTVEVAAVNVLGTGVIASATISIISTVVVPTSSSMIGSSSTVRTVSPSVTSSSSSSTGAIVTSSTSSTPLDSTSTGGSNSTVYIGIGAGVALIAIVILIILIVVGCLIWCKPWKGEKENITTNTVI